MFKHDSNFLSKLILLHLCIHEQNKGLLERRNKYIAEKEKAKTSTETSNAIEDGNNTTETVLEDANIFETKSEINVENENLPQTNDNIAVKEKEDDCELIEVKINNLSSINSNEYESIFSNKIDKNDTQTDKLLSSKLIINDGKYIFIIFIVLIRTYDVFNF